MNYKLHILLIRHFAEFWWIYLLALISLFITHYCQSYLPFLAKELGDVLIEGREFESSLLIYLAVAIVIFRTLSRLLFFYPARIQQKNLRVEFLQRFENSLPYRYREKYNDGQIYQIIFNDINQMRGLVGFACLQIGNCLIAFAVLLPRIADFNPKFLMAFLPMVITVALFTLIISRYKPHFVAASEYRGETQNLIIESYEGKKTIKNFQAEIPFINKFSDISFNDVNAFFQASLGRTFAAPLLRLGFGASLLWGAYIVWADSMQASALILFSGFAFLLRGPLAFFSWIGVIAIQALAAWKRIKELVEDLECVSPQEHQLIKMNPEYTNILHVPWWTHKLELEVALDQWNVVVGPTAVGKTTLLQYYCDYLRLNKKNYAFVAQEPYLFNDSIINNVLLGREKTEETENIAFELLVLFGLDLLATDKKSLLDLEVGENGKRLSGGQVKRLCLVRSIMSRPDFLIWDDPFSSVDYIHEEEIINKLKTHPQLQNVTFLITSHRLTSVRNCDHVCFLDKKGVIEQGKTNSLLIKGKKTFEFFEKQQLV